MRGGGLWRPRPRGLGGDSDFLQNKPFTNSSRPIPVVTLDISLSKHDRSLQVYFPHGISNVRLSPLAEDFRSVGSQPQLKSPWFGTSLVYRGVSTINLFPSEYYYSVCSWDAGVGETAASGFLSFLFLITTSNSLSSRLITPIMTASRAMTGKKEVERS